MSGPGSGGGPARVGLNLLWLVPGVVGGSEVSTVTTLHAIAADRPADLHHVLFVLDPFLRAHPELAEQFEIHVLPQSGRLKGLRVAAEQTWLPRAIRRHRIDLVHHLGGTAPLVPSGPGIVSIHDLQPFDHPGHFHPAKRAWLRVAVPRSATRARLVLTPSEWVRSTVIERFRVDPARVVAVPHGLPESVPPAPIDAVRRRLDVPGRFVLYPAITYPHKDHLTLVRAFAAIADAHPDVLLVLTGAPAAAEGEVRAEIGRLGLGARVRRTGRVPAAEVVALLGAADVLAVPSRYEGFGLPALEGMGAGRPVVAAAATALPEVVGDGGLLVPAGDVTAWSAALDLVLGDPDAAARLAAAGRRRAGELTAAACARRTVAAHRRALGG